MEERRRTFLRFYAHTEVYVCCDVVTFSYSLSSSHCSVAKILVFDAIMSGRTAGLGRGVRCRTCFVVATDTSASFHVIIVEG